MKECPSFCVCAQDLHAKLSSYDFHISPCVALQREGEAPDPTINQGVRWLLDTIARQWAVLDGRVKQDTLVEKEKEQKRKEEQRARVAARKGL